MERPVAFKVHADNGPEVYRVGIDPIIASQLRPETDDAHPAVILTRKVTIVGEASAGMFDKNDLLAVTGGADCSNALLIVIPEASGSERRPFRALIGDSSFLEDVRNRAPGLVGLAEMTTAAIRKAGIGGRLVEGRGGRWVNRPLNSFTLKVQPRAQNLHFTLYGSPESFDSAGFLLPDQNSYSRGWIRTHADADRFAELARLSYDRRSKAV